MTRMKASDFDPRVLKLFDGYVHGVISRRGFLDRAAAYTVGGVTAAALLESLSPGFAGIPNPLFAADNTLMFFSDAQKAALEIIAAIKEA